MKKILFVIFSVTLLLSLSVCSLAISNEYTFSDIWNKSSFAKSYVIANNQSYQSDIVSSPMLILNNGKMTLTLVITILLAFRVLITVLLNLLFSILRFLLVFTYINTTSLTLLIIFYSLVSMKVLQFKLLQLLLPGQAYLFL